MPLRFLKSFVRPILEPGDRPDGRTTNEDEDGDGDGDGETVPVPVGSMEGDNGDGGEMGGRGERRGSEEGDNKVGRRLLVLIFGGAAVEEGEEMVIVEGRRRRTLRVRFSFPPPPSFSVSCSFSCPAALLRAASDLTRTRGEAEEREGLSRLVSEGCLCSWRDRSSGADLSKVRSRMVCRS